jgi:RNA polymerase sigma factor (sigma-70 family)
MLLIFTLIAQPDPLNLWKQLKEGDKNALRLIYDEHADVMFRYGMKICGDSHTVEDCIQSLFLRIWEKRHGLGETTSMRNYLLASLRRAIYKYGDKRSFSTDPVELRGEDQTEDSFEQLIILNEMNEEQKLRFQKAIQSISARQREVIYLRFYEDKDYDEICQIMDISYQGARNMLFKALKSLKDKLSIVLIFIIKWVTIIESDAY